MKKNLDKKKIIVGVVIAAFIVFILWYSYFYKPEYNLVDDDISIQNILSDDVKEINQMKTEDNMKNYIMIHVAGAVKEEGVIKIDEDSRIIDVIEKAGGLEENANIDDVNLAYTVQDGQKIYIPSEEENNEEPKNIVTTGIADTDSSVSIVTVNINKATQTELEAIPGIGPSTASSIISYRKENGKFKSIDEIKNISGIGEAKFEKIKEYICV